MRPNISDRVRTALSEAGVSTDKATDVLRRAFGAPSVRGRASADDDQWETLLSTLSIHIRSFNGNLSKTPAHTSPLAREYYDLLRATRMKIQTAQSRILVDDAKGSRLPNTLAAERAQQAQINRALKAQGLPLVGAHTGVWQTWVDPVVRRDLAARVETAYTNAGVGVGRRWQPFITPESKRTSTQRLKMLRNVIADQRRAIQLPGRDRANTPYGALHLMALRSAERRLDEWEKDVSRNPMHAVDLPLPVQWQHLLPKNVRERVAAADATGGAAGVTLEGIHMFYEEPDHA